MQKRSAALQKKGIKNNRERAILFFFRRYTDNCDKCSRLHVGADFTIIHWIQGDSININGTAQITREILEMTAKSLFVFISNFLIALPVLYLSR